MTKNIQQKIPNGMYDALILGVEGKRNKADTGGYIRVIFEIQDTGAFFGARVTKYFSMFRDVCKNVSTPILDNLDEDTQKAFKVTEWARTSFYQMLKKLGIEEYEVTPDEDRNFLSQEEIKLISYKFIKIWIEEQPSTDSDYINYKITFNAPGAYAGYSAPNKKISRPAAAPKAQSYAPSEPLDDVIPF